MIEVLHATVYHMPVFRSFCLCRPLSAIFSFNDIAKRILIQDELGAFKQTIVTVTFIFLKFIRGMFLEMLKF